MKGIAPLAGAYVAAAPFEANRKAVCGFIGAGAILIQQIIFTKVRWPKGLRAPNHNLLVLPLI